PGAGDICDQHRAFAVESRCLALDFRVLGNRDQVLGPELLLTGKLGVDESELLRLGLPLRSEPTDFPPELGDALAELGLLSGPRRPAAFKQAALAGEKLGEYGVTLSTVQRRRDLEGCRAVTFGLEARREPL